MPSKQKLISIAVYQTEFVSFSTLIETILLVVMNTIVYCCSNQLVFMMTIDDMYNRIVCIKEIDGDEG